MEPTNGSLAPVVALTEALGPGQWVRYSVDMPLLDVAFHSALQATYGTEWNSWGHTGSRAVIAAWNSAAYVAARIDILRGKGGLRYGQDAAGGVVLIHTKEIRHMTGNIKVYGGSHDTLNSGAAVNAAAGRLTAGLSSVEPSKLRLPRLTWKLLPKTSKVPC